jgi:hypothetical protein
MEEAVTVSGKESLCSSNRSQLRGEPLLSQTLRREGQPARSAGPQEESPGSLPKLDEKARKLLEDDLKGRPFASLQDRCVYIRGGE